MRSDSLLTSERAHVLVAPPGADPKDYAQARGETWRGRGNGRGRRNGGGRGKRGAGARMDVD